MSGHLLCHFLYCCMLLKVLNFNFEFFFFFTVFVQTNGGRVLVCLLCYLFCKTKTKKRNETKKQKTKSKTTTKVYRSSRLLDLLGEPANFSSSLWLHVVCLWKQVVFFLMFLSSSSLFIYTRNTLQLIVLS